MNNSGVAWPRKSIPLLAFLFGFFLQSAMRFGSRVTGYVTGLESMKSWRIYWTTTSIIASLHLGRDCRNVAVKMDGRRFSLYSAHYKRRDCCLDQSSTSQKPESP